MLGGIVLSLALLLLVVAVVLRQRAGLPWGRVAAADVGAGRPLERPLVAARYGLVGKPDYLIERGGVMIPVEVNPGRRAPQPYDSDLMQLAAYCLLLEETTGHAPPYGFLRYANATFRLAYTPAVRQRLVSALAEMRALLDASDAARSHNDPRRCAGCGFRTLCDDALAD
ncbi:MAG: Dna2/Cas4 domain-containing protein [Chloroflexaceae bacterium]|nr:Dna2/Cas4 domain-containing protein [Chloroflexaceae bacterium]